MKLNYLLAGFLFLFFISSCETPALIFEDYTSTGGKFKAKLPSNYTKVDKMEMTPFGKQMEHYIIWKPPTLSISKFKLFQISYTDCPGGYTIDSSRRERYLDSCIEHRIKDFTENESVLTQTINFNGYSGKAFILDIPDQSTITIAKECIVGGVLYDLTAVVKRNYSTANEVNIFYNSFQVIR